MLKGYNLIEMRKIYGIVDITPVVIIYKASLVTSSQSGNGIIGKFVFIKANVAKN